MKPNPIFIVIFLCSMLFLTACSVSFEKRRYRPGYHIETVHSSQRRQHSQFNKNTVGNKGEANKTVQVIAENNKDTAQALVQKDVVPVVKNKNRIGKK